ncbi:TRAP transporter small permease [Niallia endozanthoxylica]|uniref:TRAP transporter small permease n=1 Tax=Niallia endozanthoxylica TaxID=2036016 RepID=A0A5J5I1Z0_9BACI|nr:TRAP transporter small permease [Niallia endozanthoxylica]KAA9028605.1 TRAP transporter small permease [Niallia endozanthoxylica]
MNQEMDNKSLLASNENEDLSILVEADTHWIDHILNRLTRGIEILAMISVGLMCVSLILGVFFRKILKSPLIGTDEIAMFFMLWITFLGACIALSKRDMVAVTFIVEKLPSTLQTKMKVHCQILILGISAALFYYGYQWVMTTALINATTAALKIPMWIPNMIFPLSMLIMVIYSIANIRYYLKQG